MDSTSPSSSSLHAARSPRLPRPDTKQHGAEGSNMEAPVVALPTRYAPLMRTGRLVLRPPYTVESIFRGFTNRRKAVIHALTRDEEVLFDKCQEGMQPLYLWGNTDGSWVVKPPELYLPPSLPEPALGINKSRDKMKRHKWIEEVAVHCDAWLINVSFFLDPYFTAKERQWLFTMINSLPTVRETLLASDTYHRLRHLEEKIPSGLDEAKEVVEEEVANEDNNFCASCGDRYHANAFWICCNVCDCWYHGKCVKITASKAESIDHYECPECYSEKIGHDYDEDPTFSGLFKRY